MQRPPTLTLADAKHTIATVRVVPSRWSWAGDAGNRGKNAKHGVADGEAEQVFFGEPLLILPDLRHSDAEARCHALGQALDGRLLHVTFTLRNRARLIRIISARVMHRKERAIYEAKAKEST
jgi:uncharacterized DUF497 family protein